MNHLSRTPVRIPQLIEKKFYFLTKEHHNSFYSIAVMSFFCHIMKNIHQDDVDNNKVIKKIMILHGT